MIIACDRCYARYRYDPERFGGKASKKVRCTKCLAIFEIFNKAPASGSPDASGSGPEDTVLRLANDDDAGQPARTGAGGARRREGPPLEMPADSRVSVAVIAGPDAGRIHVLEKARVVIGRHDADINVEDPEISRHHAAIELNGEAVTLVDLGSTNGTFVGEERIQEVALENQAEFSIGGSTLMLIVTAKE